MKEFQEWKAARREELSEYQKQIAEQYLANVEKEQERWQNAKKANNNSNNVQKLQESMDKELETHRLEHGPKKRKMADRNNNEEEEEDYMEDVNIGEEDVMDDVLGEVDERNIIEEPVASSKPDSEEVVPDASPATNGQS